MFLAFTLECLLPGFNNIMQHYGVQVKVHLREQTIYSRQTSITST